MTSVRRRLLVGTAAATIAIFVAAAGSLYLLARQFLVSEFDSGLRTKVGAIVSMTEFDPFANRLDAEDAQQMPEFTGGSSPEYFEIASDDARHVALSPTLKDQRLRGLKLPSGAASAAGFIRLPDGRPGRALMFRAKSSVDGNPHAPAAPDITVTVAKASAPLDRLLGRLRMLLAIVCGIATIALLALTALVIRRGLRPLEQLARGIGDIGAEDLSARLRLTDVPAELSPIVSRLNDLLARLDAAFEREKCFTADAAHELRTPLAGLAAALEVCAREKRDVPRYERVVHECLKVVRQMHAVIDNLLLLARADASQVAITGGPVDVAELLRSSWASHEPVAAQRGLAIEMDVADDLSATTDGEKLAIVVNNVFENAVHYAEAGGEIHVAASSSAGSLRFSVANTGSRVRAEDGPRVFDRFWRGDSARSSGGRNCGLGLAVCRKLAAALGATISARSTYGGWFIIELELPGATSRVREGSFREETPDRVDRRLTLHRSD